jgi:hypothetical protein
VAWLCLVAVATLGWRWWLSAALPPTGDEALFHWWAPVNWLHAFVVTDTPLILWAALP